jgi:hypothetical protein
VNCDGLGTLLGQIAGNESAQVLGATSDEDNFALNDQPQKSPCVVGTWSLGNRRAQIILFNLDGSSRELKQLSF